MVPHDHLFPCGEFISSTYTWLPTHCIDCEVLGECFGHIYHSAVDVRHSVDVIRDEHIDFIIHMANRALSLVSEQCRMGGSGSTHDGASTSRTARAQSRSRGNASTFSQRLVDDPKAYSYTQIPIHPLSPPITQDEFHTQMQRQPGTLLQNSSHAEGNQSREIALFHRVFTCHRRLQE